MKNPAWKRSVVLMVMLSMLWASSPIALVHAEDMSTGGEENGSENGSESEASSDTEVEEETSTEEEEDTDTDENEEAHDDEEVSEDTPVEEEDEEDLISEEETTEPQPETETENVDEEEDLVDESEQLEESDAEEEDDVSSISATTSTTTYENSSTSTDPIEETATSTQEVATTTASTTITTGTSVALANILNLVNANFINSDGVVLFENFFEALAEDFDLRDIYNAATSYGCSLSACTTDGVRTNIENDAVIENELYVEAISGGNTVENGGDATIETGDAYAGVNLVNIANTNVIDSNYLLLTMNAFQDVDGDIVFPSLSTFFSQLAGGSPGDLDIENTATVVNNVELDADSGNNIVDGAASSTIRTGESAASTNVFNQLNTTLGGGQSLSIIFRVHGAWAGEIFGAPDNLSWMDNGEGGIYIFDNQGGGGTGGNTNISATNTASITNNVNVVALTGENAISGSETALISTGNAYAGANIMNVANATVVGRNWMLAIINILGDFNGNIAFGRPDLWIGGQANVPNTIRSGSEIEYTLTVINNGDSPATDVVLSNTYDDEYLEIVSASVPFEREDDDMIRWDIPDLDAGEATEITYTGIVRNAGYNTDINSAVSVDERERDHNDADNADIIIVTTSSRPPKKDPVRVEPVPEDEAPVLPTVDENMLKNAISVERLSSDTTVNIGTYESSAQRIVVANTTDQELSGVVFHDFVRDPYGRILHEDIWDLGAMLPHEEIEITYVIDFNPEAAQGIYTLTTRMDWNGRHKIFGENGTILAWGGLDAVDTVPLAAAALIKDKDEEAATTTAPFWEAFLPKTAEAAGMEAVASSPDLFDRLGTRGVLTLLASLMILYGWHRRDWRLVLRRRMPFGWRGRMGNMGN